MNAQPAETQPDTLPVKGLAGLLALSSLLQYLSFFSDQLGFFGVVCPGAISLDSKGSPKSKGGLDHLGRLFLPISGKPSMDDGRR